MTAFKTVTVGYSALCNALMLGLQTPVSEDPEHVIRTNEQASATLRAVATLVTGERSGTSYKAAFFLMQDMHAAGAVAGDIALRVLETYGA